MIQSYAALFLGRARDILSFLGIWFRSDKSIPHQIFMVVIMALEYSFLTFQIIMIVQTWGHVNATDMSLMLTQSSTIMRVTAFLANESNFRMLVDFMESEVFNPKNEKHERILKESCQQLKTRCLYFFVSSLITCTLWAMVQFVETGDGPMDFPFHMWMPVSPARSPGRELGWIYQLFTIYVSVLLFISVDYVILAMIMYGCAQLRIIREKLKEVRSVPFTIINNKPKRDKVLKNNNIILSECIRHHQAVVRFIEAVENTCHLFIFVQLAGMVGIICYIGVQLVSIEVHIDVLQFISLMNFLMNMMYQLLLNCWTGHDLTIWSEKLRDALYLCPWYDQDLQYRRMMLIAMERMKNPIRIRAGHYVPLHRPTFVAILRSSYSYFTVLKTTNSK